MVHKAKGGGVTNVQKTVHMVTWFMDVPLLKFGKASLSSAFKLRHEPGLIVFHKVFLYQDIWKTPKTF